MNYVESNNKYFKRSAGKYDRNTSIIKGARKKLLQEIYPTANDHILDVATGTGAVALMLAAQGARVKGIDLSKDMLQVAESKNSFDNLQFMAADACKLPFSDNQFSISTTSFALHDMPLDIRNQALQEMKRVTKPGGRIVIMDYHPPKNPLWRGVANGLITMYEELNYREFIKKDLKTYLESQGFKVTKQQTLLLNLAQLVVCEVEK